MDDDQRTIRNYELAREAELTTCELFSKLSGRGQYYQANMVGPAMNALRRVRQDLHPEYIEAKNRTKED